MTAEVPTMVTRVPIMVAVAYGFIWLAVFAYVFLIGRKANRLDAELEELRRRVERGAP